MKIILEVCSQGLNEMIVNYNSTSSYTTSVRFTLSLMVKTSLTEMMLLIEYFKLIRTLQQKSRII